MITYWLLAINAILFILSCFFPATVQGLFGLHSFGHPNSEIYQFITYQFVHANLLHFFVNMVGLWTVGEVVEKKLGGFLFLGLYISAGILGGALNIALATGPTCLVGASGAVYGLFGAMAVLAPHARMILIFFPFFPIKVKFLFPILMALEVCAAFFLKKSIVGHWCHIAGGVSGWLMAKTCADFVGVEQDDC